MSRALSRSLRRRGPAVGLAVAAALALAAPPASAGQLESGSFDFTDSYEHDECGFTLAFENREVGSYTISTGTPQTGGQYFRVKQRVVFTSTVTNPATGEYFTENWRSSFREMPAKLVEGEDGVVTYRTHESGQWDVFRNSEGKIVYLNAGTVVTKYTFDTLGDSQPGGNFLDDELVRVSGRFDTFDRDFCDIAEELIG